METKEDFDKLKAVIEYNIEKAYGPRCKTKDTDDFDDLIQVGDSDAGRCPCCLVYEKFDKFWSYFEPSDMEMS